MTIAELYHSAQLKFGMSADNARFADDFIAACNDAQNDAANRRGWGFLLTAATFTTVDGTRTVSLPSDFGRFADEYGVMRITSPTANLGTVVKVIPFNEYYHREYDSDEEGTPEWCYVLGDTAYFSPVPDAAYTLAYLYYKRPTTIVTATGNLTFPERYHELIKKSVWRRLQDDGYSSVQELAISDGDVEKAFRRAALDDESRYGGMVFNLPDSAESIYTT